METDQFIAQINALPEQARRAIEQLVLLLAQQPPARKMPPILQASSPLTAEEKAAEQAGESAWATRTDITDGAQYIHEVRRGLRQP